ncbi:MAG TPA: CarD family transcriptional regulator [Gaiellaceae bacterium]|nr:CarD family transcriptional regulator [Gaiellaceae bacterium]
MRLVVGDIVVYRNHGVGRVAARRKQELLGETQEVVVLELDKLTVTLPLTSARTRLRPLADKAELRRVADALREEWSLSSRNWLSRRKETLEKLVAGTPVELAQIVSEGAQRERVRSASGGKGGLSVSERQLCTEARTLLSGEVALVLGIQPAAAETWIDGHLARSV